MFVKHWLAQLFARACIPGKMPSEKSFVAQKKRFLAGIHPQQLKKKKNKVFFQ